MSKAYADNLLPIFGELLAELRARGFSIGVEHYLRVQALLERVGDERTADEWPSLLAPILVSNQAEQAQFYEIFPRYLGDSGLFTAPSLPGTDSPGQQQIHLSSPLSGIWRQTLIVFAALVLLLGLVFFLFPKKINSNENANTFDLPDTATAVNPFPTNNLPPSGSPDTIKRINRGFYVGAFLLPCLLFFLYEWRRRQIRRRSLAAHRLRHPPHDWPLYVSSRSLGFFEATPLYTAARNLRSRHAGEVARVDVEASVKATIQAAGFPVLRRQTASKVPEYLILIDKIHPRDHLASLYLLLVKALEHEGVFLNCYFFSGDPRVCFNPHDGSSHFLADLQNLHYGTRLLIFSDGEQLLDAISGRLSVWSHIFEAWSERVILTPESTELWGRREEVLAEFFTLLPATLAGLAAIPEYLHSHSQPELRFYASRTTISEEILTDETPLAVVNNLRRKLPLPLFRWLCVCSVYHKLHWDLTIQLAALASSTEVLLTETNLLTLMSLPWFRQGTIPDEFRWELMHQLDPGNETDVRRFIIALQENNPPPPGSIAESQHDLALAFHYWRVEGGRQRLRELLNLLQKLPFFYATADSTISRWLAPEPWRWADTVARWRELLRREPRLVALAKDKPVSFLNLWRTINLPPFSLETGAVAVLALVLGFFSLLAVRGIAPPTVDEVASHSATPTPLPLPTPDVYLPPDAIPGFTPPDIGQSPYTPPSLPLPTPFFGNPPVVPLPGLSPRPRNSGTPDPSGLPLTTSSPDGSPSAGPLPTVSPTPVVVVPTILISASHTGVCLTGPTSINLTAVTTGFPASAAITFNVNGGKLLAKAAGPNPNNSQTWDLSEAQPGLYTATAEATEGKTKKSATFSAKVYACGCEPEARILCPVAPITKTPFTVIADLPKVDSNWQASPVFKWSVSGGKIVSGQGTPQLTLDLTGANTQTLQLSTETSGFPPLCKAVEPVISKCEITLAPALAVLLAEVPLGNPEVEQTRLNVLTKRLKESKGEIQIDIFGTVDAEGKPVDTAPVVQRLTEYLVKTQRLEATRLKFTSQPEAADGKLKIRIYLAPN